MSSQLLLLSEDLQRLVREGYEVAFKSNMLLVGVAYVNREKEVARGVIVSSLESAGDKTASPISDHTVKFIGESGAVDDQPCDNSGNPLTALMNQPVGPIELGGDLAASCGFSQKPPNDRKYLDYFEKMTTYADIFLSEVHLIDPTVKIQSLTPLPVAIDEEESVHRYFDSATSLAQIGAVSDKTKGLRVAIVGLGGTGSYILDAVTKTHVQEIHIYDRDEMEPHNAFRAPGAISLETLKERPLKVDHHFRTYDALHRHVIAHPSHIDASTVEELRGLDFVFVSIDSSPVKKIIVDNLVEFGVPFVDTGMGIDQTGNSLGGMVRTTRILSGDVDKKWVDENFSYAPADDDIYDQNIQIVELNMLNAALAVIAWKKHIEFYRDYRHEVESVYTIDGNLLSNAGAPVDD